MRKQCGQESAETKPIEPGRTPTDPAVRLRDRVRSVTPPRDAGRADLPVIGPRDTPRSVTRRLV